jgi:NADH:ubiquinone oxidoreductase subunit 2 (subunit N)
MAFFSFFNSSSFAYPTVFFPLNQHRQASTYSKSNELSELAGRSAGAYALLGLISFAFFAPFISSFSASNEFVNFDRSFYTKGRTLSDLAIFSYFPIVSISIVAVAVILFALPLAHGGELTRFLHRIAASYLLFHLFVSTNGFALRFEDVNNIFSLVARQNDLVFSRFFHFLATLFLVAFFYGVSERFIFSRAADIEFPLLVLLLHIGGLFAVHLPTLRDLLLALEIVTLGSYVLLAAERQNRFSTYSGVQSFLLGSVPSARLLLGFGLLYFQTGSLSLSDLDLLFGSTVTSASTFFSNSVSSSRIRNFLTEISADFISNYALDYPISSFSLDQLFSSLNPISSVSVIALRFILFNFLFKLTAAPFHV